MRYILVCCVVIMCSCTSNNIKQEIYPVLECSLASEKFGITEDFEAEFTFKNTPLTIKFSIKENYLKAKVKRKQTFLEKSAFILFPLQSDSNFVAAKKQIEIGNSAKNLGIISPKMEIISIHFSDGKTEHYLFQEKANKQLIESNFYREGLLFKVSKKGKVKEEYSPKDYPKEKIKDLETELSINDYIGKFINQFRELTQKHNTLKREDFMFYINPISNNLELLYYPRTLTTFEKSDLLAKYESSKALDVLDENLLNYFSKGENPKSLFPKNKILNITKNLIIPAGYKVIIPKGTHINLTNNAAFITHSALLLSGEKGDSIYITSSDNNNNGFHVLNAGDSSFVNYVSFSKLKNLHQQEWKLPSAVTFYNSSVIISNSSFANNQSEDALNLFRCNFSLSNTVFKNTSLDALDVDFSTGKITFCDFINCGNDGSDFSGSTIVLTDCYFEKTDDKAMSIGEKTTLKAKNVSIKNCSIGVVGKDGSKIEIKNISIYNTELALCLFRKKTEFNYPELKVEKLILENIKEKYLLEKNCILFIDGKKQKALLDNVEKYLYGKEYGKASN